MQKPKTHISLVLTIVSTALILSTVAGLAQSGGNIDLRRNVIAGGGGTATGGGNLQISGTAGQAGAGTTTTGGSITQTGGFWHAAQSVPTPTPSPQSGPGVFAFSAGTYAVNEDCTDAVITITRTNGSTGPASVDFSTANGTGYAACALAGGSSSQNCDFSYTTGTVAFADGETSKTFRVLISKDAYIEGDETIALSLANATGSTQLGAQSTATLMVVDNGAVATSAQPIDDAATFVGQTYHDFLARQADAAGLNYWAGQISQCHNDQNCLNNQRVAVSNAFFFELEYQQTGSYVFRLYRAAYGNSQPFPNPDSSNPAEANKVPSYAAYVRDRAQVVGGSSLAQSQLDLANAFVQRPEFLAKYPASLNTAQSFINAVLQTLQSADGVDLSAQVGGLISVYNSGGRGAVLYRLADDNATNPIANQEFLNAEYNRGFVVTQYFGYLRRDADVGGLLFWLGQVNSAPLKDAGVQHAMVCSFITSGEYQNRFSANVTHTNQECAH